MSINLQVPDSVARSLRLPEGEAVSSVPLRELLFPSAEEVEDLVVGRLGSSAMFAARFRENAARSLLLPRRRPGSRTPLWQQRQRSASLLAVARVLCRLHAMKIELAERLA